MKQEYSPIHMQNSVRQIDGWLSPHEARLLYQIAKSVSVDGDIVEIGSWKGKSTIALAYGIKASGIKRTIAAVDPHKGIVLPGQNKPMESTRTRFMRHIRISKVDDIVRPYVMTSLQASKIWNTPIAVLFIDGIHDYVHAKEDYINWIHYVVDNGVIAFHDCFCGVDEVGMAALEVMAHADTISDIGTVGSILYGIKGKAQGISRIIVIYKIMIIKFVHKFHRANMVPKWIRNILIHKIIRLLLVSRYTREVYV